VREAAGPHTGTAPRQAALSSWEDSRVLHWHNFEPGAFGGYVSNADNVFFDGKVHLPLTYYQGWCAADCGGWLFGLAFK
jgi:hypothetical protein